MKKFLIIKTFTNDGSKIDITQVQKELEDEYKSTKESVNKVEYDSSLSTITDKNIHLAYVVTIGGKTFGIY